MKPKVRRSPLALAILALLDEEPLHPYRMQQLIKEREKDAVINVRLRASLYQTIERLLREGLIAVQETTRTQKRPERTVYRLTATGQEMMRAWMRAMLSTPERAFLEFPAALAHLNLLTPEDVRHQLQRRASVLAEEIAAIDERMRLGREFLPRLFLIEAEYVRAMQHAELVWIRELIADLESGEITWSEAWLRDLMERFARSPALPGRRKP